MSDSRDPNCPECVGFDRRELLRYVSIAPAVVAAGAGLKAGCDGSLAASGDRRPVHYVDPARSSRWWTSGTRVSVHAPRRRVRCPDRPPAPCTCC